MRANFGRNRTSQGCEVNPCSFDVETGREPNADLRKRDDKPGQQSEIDLTTPRQMAIFNCAVLR